MPIWPRCCPFRRWRRRPDGSFRIRLPRDHYVRVDANDYSVHPAAVGRIVQVTADLQRVRVAWDGRLVADHPRCWACHQSLTDPAHRAAAEALRTEHRPSWRTDLDHEVEIRSLTDYDQLGGEVA